MAWLGLIGGIVIGAILWDFNGAIVLGFIGWLVGVITKSNRESRNQPLSLGTTDTRQPPDQPGPGTGRVLGTVWGQGPETDLPLESRVARLEATVARLEARLGGAPVGEPAPAPQPMAPEPVRAAADVAPIDPARPAYQPAFESPPTPQPEREPEPPPPPATPNPIVAWLTGGNTIARVGLLILFIGFAFLLKYAAEHSMLPPELRIMAVAIGGIALLGIGWKLRHRNAGYALGMQGAGIAVLYLTTFGALRLYNLIPPEMAFLLLAGIAIFSAMLAVMQDAVALAVIAAGGGFLAPILASSGGGSHVMLFSYYLILNLGIAAVAWWKAWRPLNLTGFVFTFAIGLLWGMDRYRPEHFDTTEPFLIAFWAIYVLIAVLVARERPEPEPGRGTGQVSGLRRYVDGTLVFGVPLVAFGLQAGLLRDTEYGLAITSLAAAGVYLGLTGAFIRSEGANFRLLAQSFLALGVVFVTLTIPLALDARWTSASWALEGAAILWIGLRQNRTIARAFGLLLQIGAGIAYVDGYRRLPGGYPLVDAAFIGAVIIALSGLWIHRLLLKSRETITAWEAAAIAPLFMWGLIWTMFAGVTEIHTHVPQAIRMPAIVVFFSFLAVKFGALSIRWNWREAAITARGLLPALWVIAVIWVVPAVLPHALSTAFVTRHPLGNYGWIAWPIAFAALAWILRRVDSDDDSPYTTFLHAGTAILLAFLGAAELNWIAARFTAHGTAWSVGAAAFVPSLVVLLMALEAWDGRWPIVEHARAYRINAVLIIATYLGAWALYANFTHDGRSDPLPYLPIVNALDLAHVFGILALVAAWQAAKRSELERPASLSAPTIATITGSLGFIWLTGMLLRTVGHWGGVPYTSSAMMKSVLAQASLSVFWAVLALTAMIYATRSARRTVWVIGAVLMGVVVGKLFIVDLSNVGGIERIVSFIAVGVLMLVIGYFSPVPPRKLEAS